MKAPSAGAPATTAWRRVALFAGAVALALAFLHVLLFDGLLRRYDWTLHFHYYDWIRISLTEYGVLPLFMSDAFHSQNFLANPQTPLFGPLVWLLVLIPTDAYIKLVIVLYTAIGIVGMVTLLRDLRVALPIALVAAVTFAFNGFFSAHLTIGHHWSLGCCLLPGLVCAYRRAVLGSRGAFWGAAALNALALFEGLHHAFIWQNVFLALFATFWSASDRSLTPILTFGKLAAASAGLAAMKLVPILSYFSDYEPPYDFVAGFTPRALLYSLIAPGQSIDTVADGIGAIQGARWWEYSFYVGAPVLAFVGLGLAYGFRRCGPLLLAGVVMLVAAIDLSRWHPALDPWYWFQQMPFAISQRVPSRLVILALFALLVTASVGMQALWERARQNTAWTRVLPVVLLVFTVGVGLDLYLAGRAWHPFAHGRRIHPMDHALPDATLRGEGSVALERFEPNRVVYRVVAPKPVELLLPFSWAAHHGDWRATGFEAHKVGDRLAVALSGGERRVEVVYRPRWLWVGVGISAATALLAAVQLRRRRANSAEPDDAEGPPASGPKEGADA
jgi:hypothetical protein